MLTAVVLMDEKEGRRSAQRFGLKTVGVVGVLIEAKSRGLVARIGPLLERLRQDAGFFLSNRVIQQACTFCGEE